MRPFIIDSALGAGHNPNRPQGAANKVQVSFQQESMAPAHSSSAMRNGIGIVGSQKSLKISDLAQALTSQPPIPQTQALKPPSTVPGMLYRFHCHGSCRVYNLQVQVSIPGILNTAESGET